jgi:hypothetical protein
MKYKIKKINSGENSAKRMILVALLLLYLLCFAVNGYYIDKELPEFIYETHQKNPNAEAFGFLFY